MEEKKRLKRNYIDVQTNYDDFNNLSEGILNITKLPQVFTSGKNLFKFSPNFDIVDIGYPIFIEILDSGGEPVFHEVLEYQEQDNSINVVVYVYETTKPGVCTLTILGTIFTDRDNNPLNSDEVYEKNYKYTHNLTINTKKKNESEIIYLHYPQVTISEKRYSILEERFDPEKQKTISGYGDYFLSDENVPILRARGDLFKKDYENGIIWFPTLSNEILPNIATSSFAYSSSIQKVLTPYQLYLDSPLYLSSSRNLSDEIISSINQPYYITYNKIPVERNSTKNIKSFAVVDIFGLEPESGDVSRIKVFGKSATKPNQSYELFYDGKISEKNYLVTTSSYFVEYPVGVFSQPVTVYDFDTKVTSSLNSYDFWKTTSIKGAPIATIASSSTYLLNPISIMPSSFLTDGQEIILEQKSEYATNFTDNTIYNLVFDYSVENNRYDNKEPLLNVYASGSAFVNNTEYGAFVAEVPLTNRDDRFNLDYSVKLPVNGSGTGVLKFLMRDGTSISNIRIVSETDFGFTPNITRLYVPIKIDHRKEFLDFKIEYFNDYLEQANVTTELYSIFFEGGNVYIYGDDSYITGSQQVGDNSVIKSEGYKGLDEAKKNVLENNPLTYYFRTSTRGNHSAYVKYDNSLWTWGYNDVKQLGFGDTVNRSSPTQVGTLKYWVSASAGDSYTMAITTSGSLWGWGVNTYRQVGANVAGTSVSSPVQIGTETNWYKVFAGTTHTLGIKKDGTLWSWGRNHVGQLGLGDLITRSSPVQIGTNIWKDAAVANNTSIALKTDGTLWSWGDNDSTSGRKTVENPTVVDESSPVQIGTLSNWTGIVGNQYHYIATNTLGQLWTWGQGSNGVLGQSVDTLAKSSPVQIGTLRTWASASAGKYHSLAIKNDGTLWGWGYNYRGALGQDDIVSRSSPVQIGTGSKWLYTHGGTDFTFGIDTSGSFYAWGDNEFGQLGLNNTSHYSASILLSTSSVRPITKSLFGWSMLVGDPFGLGVVQNSVELVNEAGSYLDFKSYPAKLDMTFTGTSSRLRVESESGSIVWDGQKIVITGVEISGSIITGSILTGSLPPGIVSGSPQTLEHLYGTNIVSSSTQRDILGLAETDSPRFANLTLDGDLTARQYIVSSSVYIVTQSYSSGSTIFGDDIGDTHQFTGSLFVSGNMHEFTGSMYVSGNLHIDGDLYANILISTASYAIFAETASLLVGIGSGSFTGSLIGEGSGSFSGSHYGDFYGSASLSGSFTGSFFGQGSGSFSGSLSGSFTGSYIGTASLSGSFSGSLLGTSSYAETSSFLIGYGVGNFTGSFSGSFTGSMDATGSFTGSHFGSASLSGSFTGSFDGLFGYRDIPGGKHSFFYGTASLAGGFRGRFDGYTYASTHSGIFYSDPSLFDYPPDLPPRHSSITGSFSGSHWGSHVGSASLTGSLQGAFTGSARIGILSASQANLTGSLLGELNGTVVNGIVRDTYAHVLGDYTASNIITNINGGTTQPLVYQNNDILFINRVSSPNSIVFSGSTFTTFNGSDYDDYNGYGRFGSSETYYKKIRIGRPVFWDQSIEIQNNTKVSAGATLTVQKLIVRDGNDWQYGNPGGGLNMSFLPSAIIDGLSATGSLQGAFTGSARIGILSASQANLTGSLLGLITGSLTGSFTGSATGSFYGSGSIGRFTGVGSGSFIGFTNPGTASFYGLVSSASYIEIFESSTTWYKPSWARVIRVICIGGGGAGGPGSKSAAASYRLGGGGGAGGNITFGQYHTTEVDTSVNITVGSGGDATQATATGRNGQVSAFGGTGTNIGLYSAGNHTHGARQLAYGGKGGDAAPLTSNAGERVNGGGASTTAYGIHSANGAPGGRGFGYNAAGIPADASIDLPMDPYVGQIVINGFYGMQYNIAPTGGGGGAGLSNTGQTMVSAPGGSIRDVLVTGNAATGQFSTVLPTKKIMTNAIDVPISIYFYNTRVGMGGRGGGSTGNVPPVAGGKYGGGGGGGRAQANGTDADVRGANGGAGVVIVISEA